MRAPLLYFTASGALALVKLLLPLLMVQLWGEPWAGGDWKEGGRRECGLCNHAPPSGGLCPQVPRPTGTEPSPFAPSASQPLLLCMPSPHPLNTRRVPAYS